MSIDRYEAGIIFDGKNPVIGFAKEEDGDLVSYKQYLESHAYDQAKELKLFEAWYESYARCGWSVSKAGTWESWKACAKSSALSAE